MSDDGTSGNANGVPAVNRRGRRSLGPVHNYKRPDMSDRDHLIMMLTSGAEIEHALMVQYLYAAYSINGVQPTKELREMVEGWRKNILSVAREEMGHLLTVQNILVLLGAPLKLDREMMPWDHEYYPFPFSLEPLSEHSLQCFIYAEMPEEGSLGKPAPRKQRPARTSRLSIDEQQSLLNEVIEALKGKYASKDVGADMHRVGELYAEIIKLINDPDKIPDSDFNEATFEMQGSWDDWGRGYRPRPKLVDAEGNLDSEHDVRAGDPWPAPNSEDSNGKADPNSTPAPDEELPGITDRKALVQIDRAASRAQAVKALRALAAQGEAPHLREDETGEPSHFERFLQIYKEFQQVSAADPSFQPVHDIPSNPTTREDFHKPGRTAYIGVGHHDEVAAHYFAQLFNQRYRLLLSYLAHTFRLARNQPRQISRACAAMVMHRAFRRNVQSQGHRRPAGAIASSQAEQDDERATPRPPFEMPYSLDLPHADRDRIWRLL